MTDGATALQAPSAFVVMPIGTEGTDDHDYFRTLYAAYVKPALERAGYHVQRADDTELAGAVTRDIVSRLANADIVIADLTHLNPNVFYEIGIRHTLRRNGTILIIDKARTTGIPFDLSGYRAIMFTGDLAGVADLQKRLDRALAASRAADPEHRDNPVHDALPSLPENTLATSSETELGRLREDLAKAHRRIRDYERRVGESNDTVTDSESALSIISRALTEAREGNLLPDLMRRAEETAVANDTTGFLTVVRKLLEQAPELDPRYFITLAVFASRLGLRPVARAIYEQGAATHPADGEIRARRLANLTHSLDPEHRNLARVELGQMVGITVDGDRVVVPETLRKDAPQQLGVMLDAYHADGLDNDALAITSALVERFPDMSIVARNHARALETMGNDDEALAWFIRAVKSPDADDVTANFMGNFLHNLERHVDALECYALACLFDPMDASTFSFLASEAAWAIERRLSGNDASTRALPQEITETTVRTAIAAARSCEFFGPEHVDRCLKAARRAEVDGQWLRVALALHEDGGSGFERMTARDRVAFASEVHELLCSDLTRK